MILALGRGLKGLGALLLAGHPIGPEGVRALRESPRLVGPALAP